MPIDLLARRDPTPMLANILAPNTVYIGEDQTLRFYTTDGPPVILTAPAASGATTLSVKPIERAIAQNGDLLFIVRRRAPLEPRFLGVNLSTAASVGDTSLTVTAIKDDLERYAFGREPLAMTGFVLEWVLRTAPGATAASLTVTPTLANGIATDDRAEVAIADTDTTGLEPGTYYHTLRRIDAGSERVLAHGHLELREAATR